MPHTPNVNLPLSQDRAAALPTDIPAAAYLAARSPAKCRHTMEKSLMIRTKRPQIKTAQLVGAIQWRKAATRNAFFTLLLLILLAAFAGAQLPVPASSQFDITGFIQSATLGGAGTGSGIGATQGGFLTVNGHVITVPSNTIVILPASALTWKELFVAAPPPYPGPGPGRAGGDVPA